MSRIVIKLTERELEFLQNGGEIKVPVNSSLDHSNLHEIDISVDFSPGDVDDDNTTYF